MWQEEHWQEMEGGDPSPPSSPGETCLECWVCPPQYNTDTDIGLSTVKGHGCNKALDRPEDGLLGEDSWQNFKQKKCRKNC